MLHYVLNILLCKKN